MIEGGRVGQFDLLWRSVLPYSPTSPYFLCPPNSNPPKSSASIIAKKSHEKPKCKIFSIPFLRISGELCLLKHHCLASLLVRHHPPVYGQLEFLTIVSRQNFATSLHRSDEFCYIVISSAGTSAVRNIP